MTLSLPQQPTDYASAREHIKDGDLIYLRKGITIWSRLTEIVTRTPHFHVGIAFWMCDPSKTRRLFIVEAHPGGRRIVSLSSYTEYDMDVIASPIEFSTNCEALISNTGDVRYSIPNYVVIGLVEIFRAQLRSFNGEVCSETVSLYLNQDTRFVLPRQISPGKQFKTLVSNPTVSVKLQIRN